MSNFYFQSIICEYCDISYTVKYNLEASKEIPKFCTFCGEDVIPEDLLDEENIFD